MTGHRHRIESMPPNWTDLSAINPTEYDGESLATRSIRRPRR